MSMGGQKMVKKNAIITIFTVLLVLAFVNANPVLTAIPNNTTAENSTLLINATFTPVDNGSLTFTTNTSFITVGSYTNTSALLTIAPNFT